MNDNSFTVGIVGTGNIAWHYVMALRNSVAIKYVAGRNSQRTNELAILADSTPLSMKELATLKEKVDFCIIAVSDSSISEVSKLCGNSQIMVHTSGSVTLDNLPASHPRGVIYPLMSLSKGISVNMREVPLFVEGDSVETEKKVTQLARLMSEKVQPLTSAQRLKLHVSAVFACNFPFFLWSISQGLMEEAGLPFKMLEPLIKGLVEKTFIVNDITGNMTGPAARDDKEVIRKHLSLLDDSDREIYKFLTDRIRETMERK